MSDAGAFIHRLAERVGRLETREAAYPMFTAYTPTWTASITNPVLGNGTLTAEYTTIGHICIYVGRLVIGSTTTTGSGNWRLSLPINCASASYDWMGSARANDMGVANYVCGVRTAAVNYIDFPVSGSTFITPTRPFTWASADALYFSVLYEI